MAELFRVKRHRARQEVTEVGLGKTTIRQTNWGAVGCVRTAQSMTKGEEIFRENDSGGDKKRAWLYGEKGTVPWKKRQSCLAEKRNRAEQKGEKLMGENRQPDRQKGTVFGVEKQQKVVKRHRGRQEVTVVSLGKTTIRQANWGAVGCLHGGKGHRAVQITAELFGGKTQQSGRNRNEVDGGKSTTVPTKRDSVGKNNSGRDKKRAWLYGEKGTVPWKKRQSCLAEKRNRAEQKGEMLIGGNRQPAGHKGTALVEEKHQKAGEKRARLFGEHGTVQYEKGWCCWRIKSTAQGKSVRSLLQIFWCENDSGRLKKRAWLLGNKGHRAVQKVCQVGRRKTTPGQRKREGEIAQVGTERQWRCCGGGDLETAPFRTKKERSCLLENGTKLFKNGGKMAPAGIKWSEDDTGKRAPGGTST
ncbi:hypothetical protein T10_7696 [Trichinella papuae]|uniref:Uncharacterized protein n=1 Tax=Trichinella papuae TaxID=268474 RepID=A0A0V1M4E6_9BILA|nr:hypothetical protein T10_7696 [Trichinella papuae]